MKLAVDAFNLAADRRGMGRFARTVLSGLADMPDIDVALVVRNGKDAVGVRDEPCDAVLSLSEARRRTFDATWYPWNAMRFELRRSTTLTTIHDAFAFTHAHTNPVGRWREQSPIRRAIRHSNILTTVSQWSAREIARIFSIEPSRFEILSPVPSVFWQPVAPVASDPYVLFVAGPEERKNAGFLFAAFERAFPAREVALVIAGTLRVADEAALANAQITCRRAYPDDNALRELYCSALAVAVPSLAEGYGVMTIEAMACGTAVIAADAAALPEACDGAALMADPHDLDAWSRALARVASETSLRVDLQRRSLARAARIDRLRPAKGLAALVRRRFSVDE